MLEQFEISFKMNNHVIAPEDANGDSISFIQGTDLHSAVTALKSPENLNLALADTDRIIVEGKLMTIADLKGKVLTGDLEIEVAGKSKAGNK